MYLKSFTIVDIKCFRAVTLDFPQVHGDYSGWIVLLGGNGTGKSTLLQSIALTLMGPVSGQRLLRPEGWVPEGVHFGRIKAEIIQGEHDGRNGPPREESYKADLIITGYRELEYEGYSYYQPALVDYNREDERKALSHGPYKKGDPGWFSCGYGPFRRLSGDNSQGRSFPEREIRFATLFSESTALTQCEDWLTNLYSRSIDAYNNDRDRDKLALDYVRRIIDSLLPGDVAIAQVDSQHVYFNTLGHVRVAISDLSDGYRTFLALAIDLLRHITESGLEMSTLFEEDSDGKPRITIEGVVLVDEIDSHLHPIWQRDIGFRLTKMFPKIQFIVTSHSPFVAQAASDNGLFVLTNPNTGSTELSQPVVSVRGWRVDQILTSDLFGLTETRDRETEELLKRHEALVAQRAWGQLKPAEKTELAKLETRLSERLSAPGESVAERERFIEMNAYVDATLAKLKGAKK